MLVRPLAIAAKMLGHAADADRIDRCIDSPLFFESRADDGATCSRTILWCFLSQHEMLQLPMSDRLLAELAAFEGTRVVAGKWIGYVEREKARLSDQ